MEEMTEASDRIYNEVGEEAEIIWGTRPSTTLGDEMRVTVIATGIGWLWFIPTTTPSAWPTWDFRPYTSASTHWSTWFVNALFCLNKRTARPPCAPSNRADHCSTSTAWPFRSLLKMTTPMY
jgi:hypothetical protein